MKNISVFQGVFYGVLILIALIGLFVFATFESNGGRGAIGTVTVWGTLPEADVKAALLEDVKLNNSLKAVTYVEKPAETIVTELSNAIATSKSPDLVLASQEQLLSLEPFLQMIPHGTLSAGKFSSTFTGGASIYATADGKGSWGIPLLIDPLMLFYNRSILSTSGVASPPTTWEALTGLVSKVTTYTPTKQVTRGLIALGTYSNIHNARAILSTLFLQTDVPIVEQSSLSHITPNLGISSTETSSGPPGEAVLRFYTQFADPSKVSYTWNASLADSELAFSHGDTALYLGYASEARFLKESSPNLDFAVAPVPQPATSATKTTYGLIYAAMIPHGAKNASGAYKAAIILAGTAEENELTQTTGLAPATQNALDKEIPDDPIATVAANSALYARGWLSPPPASTDSVFTVMINDVITGREEIQAALATAERSLGAALEH